MDHKGLAQPEKMTISSDLVSMGQTELFSVHFWAHPGPASQNLVLWSTPCTVAWMMSQSAEVCAQPRYVEGVEE